MSKGGQESVDFLLISDSLVLWVQETKIVSKNPQKLQLEME